MNFKTEQISAQRLTHLDDIFRQLANIESAARACTGTDSKATTDWALLKRMWGDRHTSVFYHSLLTFRLRIPQFLARQVLRHQIGTPDTCYTEESQRYVNYSKRLGLSFYKTGDAEVDDAVYQSQADNYEKMLAAGYQPQHARIALGGGVMTTLVKSFNLPALAKFLKERSAKNAQPEAQELTLRMLEQLPEEIIKLIMS